MYGVTIDLKTELLFYSLLKNGQRIYNTLKLTVSVNKEDVMNDKFFKLSSEKQQRILNAAYKVFAHADISSSLCVLLKCLLRAIPRYKTGNR